jgi:hypothetical protein
VKHSARGVAKRARERERLASRAPEPGSPAEPGLAAAEPADAGVADAGLADAGLADAGLAEEGAGAPPAGARPATAIAAARRAGRRRAAQVPYAIVVIGVLAGLGLMGRGAQDVRGGTLVIAGALLAGSLTRLVLPEGRAGLLGSRRRLVDAAALTALGVGLLIAGLIVKASG